jgi:hypothetical protein
MPSILSSGEISPSQCRCRSFFATTILAVRDQPQIQARTATVDLILYKFKDFVPDPTCDTLPHNLTDTSKILATLKSAAGYILPRDQAYFVASGKRTTCSLRRHGGTGGDTPVRPVTSDHNRRTRKCPLCPHAKRICTVTQTWRDEKSKTTFCTRSEARIDYRKPVTDIVYCCCRRIY